MVSEPEVDLVLISHVQDRYGILYRLLIERPEYANISHKEIPTFNAHKDFVDNYPYLVWYFIKVEEGIVGSIYLTKPSKPSVVGNEIGIAILKKYQRKGYARAAINKLIKTHTININEQRIFHANIAPNNEGSIALFKELGFELVQHTYRFIA